MAHYVIYRRKEVIDGPYPREKALAICEDLDMALEDDQYEVFDEAELTHMGLRPKPKYHIQEDTGQ